jgi:TonB family protein
MGPLNMTKIHRKRIPFMLFAVAVLLPNFCLGANPLEADLTRELKDKIVIFRAFPTGARARFDRDGKLISGGPSGYWSSDGMVEIENVSIKHDRLRLNGRRVLNVFDHGKGTFSNLTTKQDFEAELQLDPSWQDMNAVKPLLDAVILRDPKELVNLVPDYWKPCVEGTHKVGERWDCGRAPARTAKNEAEISKPPVSPAAVQASTTAVVPADSTAGRPDEVKRAPDQPNEADGKDSADTKMVTSPEAAAGEGKGEASSDVGKAVPAETKPGLYKVGKGVTPPKAEYTPDPSYNEPARKAKLQGTTLLWIVINSRGEVERVKISRPLGAGLDDKAVEAVKRWKFQPATLNGKPVAVQVNVEMKFRLY